MTTHQTARSRHRSLISSAALGAAALLIPGLIGGLWFLLAADSAGYAVPAVAVVTITTAVGFTWQRSRASGRRRKAALDAYAEREIARAAAHSGPLRKERRPAAVAAKTLPGTHQ
jgi:hypothetical protein